MCEQRFFCSLLLQIQVPWHPHSLIKHQSYCRIYHSNPKALQEHMRTEGKEEKRAAGTDKTVLTLG